MASFRQQVLGYSAAAALPVGGPAFVPEQPARTAAAAPRPLPKSLVTSLQPLRRIEWVPDLAMNIGSGTWFRGLGTMIGLAGAALLFWPNFEPVQAAPLMTLDDTAQAEYRINTLKPLAQGSAMGRRMDMTSAVVPLAAAPERPTIELSATLGEGDSFGRMLQRAGVGGLDAQRVTDMVAAAVPLDQIAPGTRFAIVLGHRVSPSQPRPLDAIAFRARFDLDLRITRQGDGFAATKNAIAVDNTPLRVRGIVGTSLYRSARAAGAPAEAIQAYLRTLDQYISIGEDILPSDEFDFVIGYQRAGSGEAKVGDLLYAGLDRGGKPQTQLLRWGSDGQFYQVGGSSGGVSGVGESTSGMMTPVAGRITSGFGYRRHPILGFTRLHAGIDFGAPWGSPIYAATGGNVVFAGRHGGHGNYVKLDHGGGLGTGYGHMSRIAVYPGEHVNKGQVIGYVGSTGLSTGPHLHYEMYRNGVPVNPASVQFVVRASVDMSQAPAFKARLNQVLSVKPGAALGPIGRR